ncbi:MAG: PAS domain-containing protein [Planctomycetota bacterium]|jgi:hypothetical protein
MPEQKHLATLDSPRLLQAVVDSIADSIALLECDGTIRMVNQAW